MKKNARYWPRGIPFRSDFPWQKPKKSHWKRFGERLRIRWIDERKLNAQEMNYNEKISRFRSQHKSRAAKRKNTWISLKDASKSWCLKTTTSARKWRHWATKTAICWKNCSNFCLPASRKTSRSSSAGMQSVYCALILRRRSILAWNNFCYSNATCTRWLMFRFFYEKKLAQCELTLIRSIFWLDLTYYINFKQNSFVLKL